MVEFAVMEMFGSMMALVQIVMARMIAPRERGRYSGYLGAVFAVATVLGPLVGGVPCCRRSPWRAAAPKTSPTNHHNYASSVGSHCSCSTAAGAVAVNAPRPLDLGEFLCQSVFRPNGSPAGSSASSSNGRCLDGPDGT
jgi:MFS family permease